MQIARSLCVSDAVAQLAARGVISGYPDGTYKGAKPTTRYEMASALARALAVIDMEKASKQDVEMLKRLVVEFKDELDALGVKVDSIDSRLAVMEKDLGGWRIYGAFRFDMKWGSNAGADKNNRDHGITGKSDFTLARFRIFLDKRINETTSFRARLGQEGERSGVTNAARFEQYYVTTKLPYDITFIIGKQDVNYEGDLGLYWGDAMYFIENINMLRFNKDWGKANLDLFVGRQNDDAALPTAQPAGEEPIGYERYIAGLKFTYDFTEKFQFALVGRYVSSSGDEMKVADVEYNASAWSLQPFIRYRFDNGIAFRAYYSYQKQGSYFNDKVGDDKAKEWGILLDVPQSVLKFTRLRADYRNIDNNFYYYHTDKTFAGDLYAYGTNIFKFRGDLDANSTSKVWSIRLDQKWSDKWETFAYYVNLNLDMTGRDDVKQWGIGAKYWLNPAMSFQLIYDSVDAGNNRTGKYAGEKDNMIRLRTEVTF